MNNEIDDDVFKFLGPLTEAEKILVREMHVFGIPPRTLPVMEETLIKRVLDRSKIENRKPALSCKQIYALRRAAVLRK